ncbi:MAG: nitroreductase family protein [Chloroflexi bacterium]|nr:nitroreductase family protein [Chloroflexota bacterium]
MNDSPYRPMPLDYERLSEDEARERSKHYVQAMLKRRTVRDFSTRPVPRDLIDNAIVAANSAPSGANQQPWTFAVITDPALKAKIRDAAEAEERENYGRRMSDEWKAALAHIGTTWEKPHLTDAPVLIVVFAQSYGRAVDPITGAESQIKHYYVAESVGIAVGMLLSALHLAGLATLTHTPSPMGFLADLLRRPSNERAYVLIPVGYPAEDAVVPTLTKKSLADVMVRFDPNEPSDA